MKNFKVRRATYWNTIPHKEVWYSLNTHSLNIQLDPKLSDWKEYHIYWLAWCFLFRFKNKSTKK